MIAKKAIGPVIATSLLLVVAVAAIVGFQSWYQTFSTDTFADVDDKSGSGVATSGIETVVGTDLYFKNGFGENLTIESIRVGDNDCGINGTYSNNIETISIVNCTENISGSQDVIVTTNKGVFVKRIYYKNNIAIVSNLATINLFANKEGSSLPGDRLLDIIEASDLNFYAVGYTGGAFPDIRIIKYNSSGNTTWVKQFNTSFSSQGLRIIETVDGNLAISGFIDTGNENFWLLKIDLDGNYLWDSMININPTGTERAYSIKQDSSSNYYLSGKTYDGSQYDCSLIKLNSSGDIIWNKTYGHSTLHDHCPGNMIVDSNNNIYFVGGHYDGTYYPIIFKVNLSGDLIWNKTLSNSGFMRDLIEMPDGNILVTSQHYDLEDFWILKLNSIDGSIIWDKTYGISGIGETPFSILKFENNNYFVGGYVGTSTDYDFWLLNINSTGNQIWNKTYGGSSYDYGFSLKKTSDGGLIFGGEAGSYSSGFWILKLDSDGNTCDYSISGNC